MAVCIPFSTWTAAAKEVSSFTFVWTVANACLDSTRRIAAADLDFPNNFRIHNDANDAVCATTRPHSGHSALGIARAGAEIPRGSSLAITFDPSPQYLDLKPVRRHSQSKPRSSVTTIIRSMKVILNDKIRGVAQGVQNIQYTFLQSLKAVRTLLKVLLPICWFACMALPLPVFPITSKLTILAVVTAPLLRDSIDRNQKAIQSFIRDSGLFAAIMDTAVLVALPGLVTKHPRALVDLFRIGSLRTRIQYGLDVPKSQVLDLYLPSSSTCRKLRGLVFFVVSKRGFYVLVHPSPQALFYAAIRL
jgi:hypothetical protein